MANKGPVGAVILAAGRSRRMGQPKMVLPWGEHTVIEQVVSTLLAAWASVSTTVSADASAGPMDIVVVTGGAREQVADALREYPVRCVYNPDYEQSEMLISLQVGLRALNADTQAVFVALGDQPGIEVSTVTAVLVAYLQDETDAAHLIVPSYQMRRGHPWLVDRSLWPSLLLMTPEQTMRDFLRANEGQIVYVPVNSPGGLKDLDTPEDYREQRP